MSKAKARLVLAPRVSKIIKWLTHNFDKEIGAVGIGGIKEIDGYPSFYVEELFFPEQEVTGATVDIKSEAFVKLRKEIGADKLSRMMFYWHRHPSGSAGCSGTDEEDTFGSFMNEKAGRKYFTFLQTATSGTGIVHEARIDVRDPFRVTITNDNIDLTVERTEEDKLVEEICNKAIEEKVTEKKYETKTTNWTGGYNYNSYGWDKYKNKNKSDTNTKAISELFNGQENLDNDEVTAYFDGCSGSENAVIIADGVLSTLLDYELRDEIAGIVDKYKVDNHPKFDYLWRYELIPKTGKYNALKTEIKRILNDYKNEMEGYNPKSSETKDGIFYVTGKKLVDNVLNALYTEVWLQEVYSNKEYELCSAYFIEDHNEVLGDVLIFTKEDKLGFRGKEIVDLVKEIQAELLYEGTGELIEDDEPLLLEAKTDKTDNSFTDLTKEEKKKIRDYFTKKKKEVIIEHDYQNLEISVYDRKNKELLMNYDEVKKFLKTEVKKNGTKPNKTK